jgi:hypothetical protein
MKWIMTLVCVACTLLLPSCLTFGIYLYKEWSKIRSFRPVRAEATCISYNIVLQVRNLMRASFARTAGVHSCRRLSLPVFCRHYQHRDSWHEFDAILESKANLTAFCMEASKQLGITGGNAVR